MATPKQAQYLKDLLVERGYLNGNYGSMYGHAKQLPYHPTLAERRNVDAWIGRLSVRQASEVIDSLKR